MGWGQLRHCLLPMEDRCENLLHERWKGGRWMLGIARQRWSMMVVRQHTARMLDSKQAFHGFSERLGGEENFNYKISQRLSLA